MEVHYHIDTPIFRYRSIHQPLKIIQLRDISLNTETAATKGTDLPLNLFSGLGVGAVVDHHLGAAVGESFHNRLADAAIATGHNRHLAVKQLGQGADGVRIGGAGHRIHG
jgi:hypothetical protein